MFIVRLHVNTKFGNSSDQQTRTHIIIIRGHHACARARARAARLKWRLGRVRRRKLRTLRCAELTHVGVAGIYIYIRRTPRTHFANRPGSRYSKNVPRRVRIRNKGRRCRRRVARARTCRRRHCLPANVCNACG